MFSVTRAFHTKACAEDGQQTEKKLRHMQSLVSFKRRRLELKFERSMKDSTQSVLEGT